MLGSERASKPMLRLHARPPPARAHRPVPNTTQPITPKPRRAILQPHRPDGDDVKHEQSVDVDMSAVFTAGDELARVLRDVADNYGPDDLYSSDDQGWHEVAAALLRWRRETKLHVAATEPGGS